MINLMAIFKVLRLGFGSSLYSLELGFGASLIFRKTHHFKWSLAHAILSRALLRETTISVAFNFTQIVPGLALVIYYDKSCCKIARVLITETLKLTVIAMEIQNE